MEKKCIWTTKKKESPLRNLKVGKNKTHLSSPIQICSKLH